MSRVAKHQSDRTNQKLYFAKLAWQQAEQALTVQTHQAFTESSVFHLYGALLAFYQELSSFYNLGQEQPTMTSIREALARQSQVSPELLLLGEQLISGYLGELSLAWIQCQYPPKPKEKSAVNNDRIDVRTEEKEWLPEISQLKDWYKELMQTIETLRESMVEF